MKKQQLLCTFTTSNSIRLTVDYIQTYYKVSNNKFFLYRSQEKEFSYNGGNFFIVYNIDDILKPEGLARNTIILHRKKQHNSFYTINALNKLIQNINNGVLDKEFQIDWELYENKLLISIEGDLKITPISFQKILYS